MSDHPELPRCDAVWSALARSVESSALDPVVRAAFATHVEQLQQTMHLAPAPSQELIAAHEANVHQLEVAVGAILQRHGLSVDEMGRLKRPTGHPSAPLGNYLFYPPPHNHKEVLVYGPDTTARMLDAGLTAKGVYTSDLYSFATPIPYGAQDYGNQPFKGDTSLRSGEGAGASRDLFNALSSFARRTYIERLVRPGLDIYWGTAVREAYEAAILETSALAGWSLIAMKASLDVPGIETPEGVFAASAAHFDWTLAVRVESSGVSFGKIMVFHAHPCAVGAKLKAGGHMSQHDWSSAVLTDILVDLLVQHSMDNPAHRNNPARLWSFVARPTASRPTAQFSYMDRSQLRRQEILRGVDFQPSELPESVLPHLQSKFVYDPDSGKSFLAQAMSDALDRGWVTRKNTPSLEDPSITVAEATVEKMQASRRRLDDTVDLATLPLSKRTKIDIQRDAGKLTVAQTAAVKAGQHMRTTQAADGSGVTKAQAAKFKAAKTMRETVSTEDESKTIEAVRVEKLVTTRQTRMSAENPLLTIQEAQTQKSVRARIKAFDTLAPVLRANSSSRLYDCRIEPLAANDANLLKFRAEVRDFQQEKDINRITEARLRVVTRMRNELVGRQKMSSHDIGELSRIRGWPENLPLELKGMKADELEYIAVKIMIGEIYAVPQE